MTNRVKRGVEWLTTNLVLEEALLVRVEQSSPTEAQITLKIGPRNLTQEACKVLAVPEDEAAALAFVEQQFGADGLVIIRACNVIVLKIDRLSRHGHPDLLFHKLASPDVEAISWTIFGFTVQRQSEVLDALGSYRDRCLHIVLDLVDGRLDLVCEELEVQILYAGLG